MSLFDVWNVLIYNYYNVDSIRSLAIFFGPMLIPKAIAYYRSVRSGTPQRGVAIQPVPPRVRLALVLLAALCLVYLAKTLPVFAPENVFLRTGSPVHIPTDSLFQRLANLRPGNALTPNDEALRIKFVNRENRFLYLKYGPEVLTDCPFCSADDPNSYFYYAYPAIMRPHLVNLAAIAIATSPSLTGKYGNQWRTTATIAAAVLCLAELYMVNSFNHLANSHVKKGNTDYFFWTTRLYRLVALAALDGILAWVLFLSSTNRAFVRVATPAERVDTLERALAGLKAKFNALAIVKNTSVRDETLRDRSQTYWAQEVRLMGDAMEEREVVDGVNDALSNRINIQTITQDAASYAETMLKTLKGE